MRRCWALAKSADDNEYRYVTPCDKRDGQPRSCRLTGAVEEKFFSEHARSEYAKEVASLIEKKCADYKSAIKIGGFLCIFSKASRIFYEEGPSLLPKETTHASRILNQNINTSIQVVQC